MSRALIRIAMAQVNPTVGDLSGNASLILSYVRQALDRGAGLVVFPELVVTGYPPEDLLLKPAFIDDNLRVLGEIAREIKDITAIIGFVDRENGQIRNAAAIVHGQEVRGVYHKMFLPNYGVFDEKRYFSPGREPLNFLLNGVNMGLGVCEDIWVSDGPARTQAQCGARVIVNINASPYHMYKAQEREDMLRRRARENSVIIVYNNMVGGQDELVFDGRGLIMDHDGRVIARARAFEEDLLVHDLALETRSGEAGARRPCNAGISIIDLGRTVPRTNAETPAARRDTSLPEPSSPEEVYRALVLGTKDYTHKNGFSHAVIALSGGIDSALVTVIAEEALGRKNITAVFMPSRYTSSESSADAKALVRNLGVEILTIPIDDIFDIYRQRLAPFFHGLEEDVTEENIQARIRGDIIMALSNKFGWLVLTTGNKSEISVGYATLYGDMAGGFSVIKDLPKTLVYSVARWINETRGNSAPIPEGIITRPPSAELRAGQTDQDTLPPYEDLDCILKAYVEEDESRAAIVEMGYPEDLVTRVIAMVDRSEYKRRQAAPGIKITPRAFGRDRRMPITNRYRPGR